MTAEQRATLIARVGTAWRKSRPFSSSVPGGHFDSVEFIDWFNAQIDAALAEGGGSSGFGVSLPAPTGPAGSN